MMYWNQDGGRIVGLAFSYSSNYVFWSDIGFGNRGIYRATTDSSGNINNAEKIVSDGQCFSVVEILTKDRHLTKLAS